MIKLTIGDIAVFFAYGALTYVTPALVGGIAILLLTPALRARRWAKRSAWALIAALLALLALAGPMLGEVWKEKRQAIAFAAATFHLSGPQTLGGVHFPAGSTVHLADDGRVEFGDVPQATLIMGAPLIGAFSLEGDELVGEPGIAKGTLAHPSTVHGIACGPGALFVRGDDVRCVLWHDVEINGYPLAGGHPVEVANGPGGKVELRFGTLRRPERLFQVLWPAGTVIGNLGGPPEQLAEASGQDGETADFCIPNGVEASVGGVALLHGPMSYTVQGGRRLIMAGCYPIHGDADRGGSYALVGAQRYGLGERTTAAAPWTWSEPVLPVSR